MRRTLLSMAALLTGACVCSANVSVQGWWHLDSTQPITDSSGNGRTFGSAYSTAPATGGAMAAQLINNGAGGALGTSGYTSAQCIRLGVGVGGKRQSAMWGIGYNPPAPNFGIEIWVLPQDNGIAGGSGGWIFSSGQSGGVAFRINAPSGESSYIDAIILGTSVTIGERVLIDTNRWMHLAIVNDNGTTTFYTNGVPCGASNTGNATPSAGDVYIGTPGDNQAFYGYLDEARMFTFAAGQFTTNDLLLRPPGPMIIGQPQNASVWTGGAAPFTVNPSFDFTMGYQWRRAGANLPGATGSSYVLPVVAQADNASTFDCVLTSGGISTTSTVATLTMVPTNPSNIDVYRSAITSEGSLIAYFPVDGDSGATLTNTKDNVHNGTLEPNAFYDGRTNTSFGERAVAFNGDGDVQIPNNPAFEFGTGNGTIEGLVYLSQATATDPTIFSVGDANTESSYLYYALRASKEGANLIYNNGTEQLSWPVTVNLVGRLAHVAFVFENTVNVTAYVDGQNLGTKTQTAFGSNPGNSAWIGSVGNVSADNRWVGSIDELAIYSSALSQNTIQTHYSKFFYGTNTAPPSIVSQPSSKTLLAGSSPVLTVKAAGTLPLTYQWSVDGGPIAGATRASLSLPNTTTASSGSYTLAVQNGFGSATTDPIVLSFVAPPSGYPSMVAMDHPTAFWRLSDSAGSAASDSAGFNDGTYASGGVTYGEASIQGEPGTAVRFNGSSGRAIVPRSTTLNPDGPFTVEFWAKPEAYTPGGNWSNPLSSMDRPARNGGYEFYMGGNYNGFEFHTAAGGGYNMITGDGTTAATGKWHHVVGVFDGTNIMCYVNGQHANPDFSDNNVVEGTAPFTPNQAVDFFIGSRSDNVRFFNGVMADVAFYNYALSENQISNHWSSAYTASQIVQQPAGVTNVEGSTITLSPVVSGLPNTYQWVKDNNNLLAGALNPDQTQHYPQDVTNMNLVISQARPSDSGLYHLVVKNPLGGSTSADARVVVIADTNAPQVTAVMALGTPVPPAPTPALVKVVFNERIDPVTGSSLSSYAIDGGVTVSGVNLPDSLTTAAFGDDWRTAFLVTSGLTPGQKYTLTVTGIKDQAQTPNTIATTTVSFTAPVLTQGVLAWDYYFPVNGGIDVLQSLATYPAAPNTNAYTTAFDSTEITGGDLNNKPGFSGFGGTYGCSLSGWITPTQSGDYTFFLASDDASQLLLSTDDKPASATLIAIEESCCHGFQEPGAPTTSTPQTLVAGKSYFIQALQTEGGGGDYVKVAWRISTDSTASTNLPPIQAQFLSAYASLPAPEFNPITMSNGQLTISWTGTGTLFESSDLVNWTPVPGNPVGTYTVTPTEPQKFYRVKQ